MFTRYSPARILELVGGRTLVTPSAGATPATTAVITHEPP